LTKEDPATIPGTERVGDIEMAACIRCGASLGFSRRLVGATRCQDCEQKARAVKDQALAVYDNALGAAMSAAGPGPEMANIASLEAAIVDGGGSYRDKKMAAIRWYLDQILKDEVLTEDEERRLLAVCEGLFRTPDEVRTVLAPYRPQLFIARVNDGRLPVLTSGRLLLKKAEVLHLEEPASTLKEVVQREYRGSSQGVSFRIAKGVYYRVGSQRGHMVEVGRSWQPDDSGTLSITSQRLVFTGTRHSVEMLYAKLLSLNVFTDAVEVHVSNRQKPTTLRVPNGPMITAAVNSAMQRLLA
jgi:hypothetical protein